MKCKIPVANVIVSNEMSSPVRDLTVLHKYSNVFRDERTWDNLDSNKATLDPLHARYRTGFGRDGADWWRLTWFSSMDNTAYETAPGNGQAVVNAVEKLQKIKFGHLLMNDEPT